MLPDIETPEIFSYFKELRDKIVHPAHERRALAAFIPYPKTQTQPLSPNLSQVNKSIVRGYKLCRAIHELYHEVDPKLLINQLIFDFEMMQLGENYQYLLRERDFWSTEAGFGKVSQSLRENVLEGRNHRGDIAHQFIQLKQEKKDGFYYYSAFEKQFAAFRKAYGKINILAPEQTCSGEKNITRTLRLSLQG